MKLPNQKLEPSWMKRYLALRDHSFVKELMTSFCYFLLYFFTVLNFYMTKIWHGNLLYKITLGFRSEEAAVASI
jgi:hypothetical protein